MIDLQITGDTVEFSVRGLWAILAMRRRVTVQREHIVSVHVESLPRLAVHGLRMPGTHLPGVVIAGTFYENDGRSFYCVSRFHEVLIVDLVSEPFRRLLINVDQPHRVTEILSP